MTAPSIAPPRARAPAHSRRTGSLTTGPSRATSTPVAPWASWRATWGVGSASCPARPAVRTIPRIAPFISATYGSRTPKSVVSVTMASNPSDRRPSAVPIHDEVRHERERLALLRRREDLEVGLRGPRVGVGPRAPVLDALVVDDQPADLLELRRDQGRTP